MLNLLIVHNFYGSENPSGENNVVLRETKLLKDQGHRVSTYFRYSDSLRSRRILGKILAGFLFLFNFKSALDILLICRRQKIDIIIVHNEYPIISIWFYFLLRQVSIIKVFHNFRFRCVRGVPFREGKICTLCFHNSSFNGIRYRCHKGSLISSIILTIVNSIARFLNIFRLSNVKCVFFSNFHVQLMRANNFPVKRSFIKQNFFDSCETLPVKKIKERKSLFYAGRIESEKGVDLLLDAWARCERNGLLNEYELHLAGSGNLKIDEKKYKRLKYFGLLSHEQVLAKIQESYAVIFPSIAIEGDPLIVKEAMSMGVPIICADVGAMNEYVKDEITGFLYDPHEINDLQRSLLVFDHSDLSILKQNCLDTAKSFSSETQYKNMLRIFNA